MTPPKLIMRLIANLFELQQARAHRNAQAQQERLLLSIVKRYRDTELGKHLGLDNIHSSQDFAEKVPTLSSQDYVPWWEKALKENTPGLVHPNKLEYMALSSGTSGARKYIPFPNEQFAVFKRFTNHGFFHAFRELNDYSLLDQNILITSALGREHYDSTGITLAYSSGMATLNATRFARSLIRPTADIIDIRDWQEKIHRTVEQTWQLDIRIATGPPLPFLALMEHLLEYANANGMKARCVRDIWPNLKVYAYSGSSLKIFENKFKQLLGEGVEIFEIYSSTEAPIAYQHKFGQSGMLVDLLTTYLEFEPADQDERAKLGRRLGIHEVKTGVPYDIVVTGVSGVFAYKLGDTVEFTSTAPYVLRFAGRIKEEINLNTEHLRLDQAHDALVHACDKAGAQFGQFFACPQDVEDASGKGNLGYEFFIEFSHPPSDDQAFLHALDQHLQGNNDLYKFYRNGDIFRFPSLTKIPPGTINRYARQNLTFGQAKFLNLHNDRTIADRIREYAEYS